MESCSGKLRRSSERLRDPGAAYAETDRAQLFSYRHHPTGSFAGRAGTYSGTRCRLTIVIRRDAIGFRSSAIAGQITASDEASPETPNPKPRQAAAQPYDKSSTEQFDTRPSMMRRPNSEQPVLADSSVG